MIHSPHNYHAGVRDSIARILKSPKNYRPGQYRSGDPAPGAPPGSSDESRARRVASRRASANQRPFPLRVTKTGSKTN